jgi:diguanylate cyclase (GGDEF)-like protein/PAS domain S-box-containing protein
MGYFPYVRIYIFFNLLILRMFAKGMIIADIYGMNSINLFISGTTRRVVLFTILAALSLWTVDSVFDAFMAGHGTFPDHVLFNVSRHEIYSRLLMIGICAGYGLALMILLNLAFNKLLHLNNIDREQTEANLRQSERFLSTIFESFHDPFNIVDRDYRLIKFNDAYARMRNKLPKDLFGKKCHEALYQRTSPCHGCIVEKTFQSTDPCAVEKQVTLSGGSKIWLEIYTYPILDRDRHVTHVIEYARDITDRKKVEVEKNQLIRKLNHLSTSDCLTGLFNRRALSDTLRHEIDRAQRYCSELSLILCDVDNLKRINDTCGHAAGDKALQAAAEALRNSLRKTDIMGRYGGDEFMVILPETSPEGAKSLAEKIRVSVLELDLGDQWNRHGGISLSIGVAGCCTATDNIETLIKRADIALYASKRNGRNMVSTVMV